MGSGRFAAALTTDAGVDPAAAPLLLARARGVHVIQSAGEFLPFRSGTIGAVVEIDTICFADDPAGLLGEARRVVRADGAVILGEVFAESPWGRFYRAKAAAGHPFYSAAGFLSRERMLALVTAAGLRLQAVRSVLYQPPSDSPRPEAARDGEYSGAGFVCWRAVPAQQDPPRRRGQGHRTVSHTADLRVEAWAGSCCECVAEALRGLVSSFADVSGARVARTLERRFRTGSPADMLASAAEEIIYILDTRGEIPVSVRVRPAGPEIVLVLDLAGRDGWGLCGAVPKAVSYHGLSCGPDMAGCWSASMTVDVLRDQGPCRRYPSDLCSASRTADPETACGTSGGAGTARD